MRTSRHKCPNCGEYKLFYPDIKGEYGTYDTSIFECAGCWERFPAADILKTADKDGKPMPPPNIIVSSA